MLFAMIYYLYVFIDETFFGWGDDNPKIQMYFVGILLITPFFVYLKTIPVEIMAKGDLDLKKIIFFTLSILSLISGLVIFIVANVLY